MRELVHALVSKGVSTWSLECLSAEANELMASLVNDCVSVSLYESMGFCLGRWCSILKRVGRQLKV